MPAQPSVPTDAYAPDRVGAESPDAMPEWLVSVLAQIILILFKYLARPAPAPCQAATVRQDGAIQSPAGTPRQRRPIRTAQEIRKLFSQLRRRYGVPPARPDVQDARRIAWRRPGRGGRRTRFPTRR